MRQLLHLIDQPSGPQVQLVRIRIFQRVLVLGTADAVIHRDVLHRVHVKHDALDRLEARLQPANHIGGADVAHIQWLQVDGHSPAIQRRVRSVRANKGRQAIDCRVLKNDGCKLLLLLCHSRKGDSLRRLRDTLNDARILRGEEPFWNDDIEHNRKHQGGGSHQQCDGLVPQNKLERTAVKGDDVFEDALRGLEEASLLLFGSLVKNPRAHHGRKS